METLKKKTLGKKNITEHIEAELTDVNENYKGLEPSEGKETWQTLYKIEPFSSIWLTYDKFKLEGHFLEEQITERKKIIDEQLKEQKQPTPTNLFFQDLSMSETNPTPTGSVTTNSGPSPRSPLAKPVTQEKAATTEAKKAPEVAERTKAFKDAKAKAEAEAKAEDAAYFTDTYFDVDYIQKNVGPKTRQREAKYSVPVSQNQARPENTSGEIKIPAPSPSRPISLFPKYPETQPPDQNSIIKFTLSEKQAQQFKQKQNGGQRKSKKGIKIAKKINLH